MERKIIILWVEAGPADSAFWDEVLAHIQDPAFEIVLVRQISELGSFTVGRLPEAVILDLTALEVDGLALYLRARNAVPDVPVIAVTEVSNRLLAIQIIQAGAPDSLVKDPNDPRALSRSMRFAIRRQIHLKRLASLSIPENPGAFADHGDYLNQTLSRLSSAHQARQALLRDYRLAVLAEAEARLAKDPGDFEALFFRARLLADLRRTEDARMAFGEILKHPPPRSGELSLSDEFILTAYSQASARHPGNAWGHSYLGDLQRQKGDTEAARAEYEIALRLKPDLAETQESLALLPPPDPKTLRRTPVLLVMTNAEGNAPFQKLLDDKIFQVNIIVAELYQPSVKLPSHRLVINAIGDADLCGPALKTAQVLAARVTVPIINPPPAVLATGRVENTGRLSKIPGLITPATVDLPKELLLKPDAAKTIAERGFTYPFLLRSPGYHLGRYFHRIARESDIALMVPGLPGPTLSLIQYLDASGIDGKFRKYRVMIVNHKIYPAHLAVSPDWKIHYFSAEMADQPSHRAEDEAFLKEMPSLIGEKALRALESIRDAIGLDYGGIDFGLDGEGNVLLFETNAYMNVSVPDPDPRWDYRRAPVARIHDAVRQMLLERLETPSKP